MFRNATVLAAALVVASMGPGLAEELKLTTLEWPPYSGSGLPEGGTAVSTASAATAKTGDTLVHEVLPWQRAVQTGLEQPGYAGYFPEYKSASLEETCAFSDSLGDSPLGLVERKDAPLAWNAVSDLGAYTIGTVKGYVNTAEFDSLAEAGSLKVEPTTDDLTNLRKVAAGRIDAAVIDRNVMDYLLQNESSLAEAAGALQFNDKLLENKTLHVCFRKDADGMAALERFNEGLAALR